MKHSKHIKKLKQESINYNTLIEKYCKKIKSDYNKILIDEKNKLISRIAEGEELDEFDLREKYLKNKNIKIKKNKKIIEDTDLEIIYDKVVLKGHTYYYENKEDGNIFDNESKQVGKYKNNNFIFN